MPTLPILVVYATDPIGATYAVYAGAIDGSTVAGSGFGSVSATFFASLCYSLLIYRQPDKLWLIRLTGAPTGTRINLCLCRQDALAYGSSNRGLADSGAYFGKPTPSLYTDWLSTHSGLWEAWGVGFPSQVFMSPYQLAPTRFSNNLPTSLLPSPTIRLGPYNSMGSLHLHHQPPGRENGSLLGRQKQKLLSILNCSPTILRESPSTPQQSEQL